MNSAIHFLAECTFFHFLWTAGLAILPNPESRRLAYLLRFHWLEVCPCVGTPEPHISGKLTSVCPEMRILLEIKAHGNFYRRHIIDIPRIKFFGQRRYRAKRPTMDRRQQKLRTCQLQDSGLNCNAHLPQTFTGSFVRCSLFYTGKRDHEKLRCL